MVDRGAVAGARRADGHGDVRRVHKAELVVHCHVDRIGRLILAGNLAHRAACTAIAPTTPCEHQKESKNCDQSFHVGLDYWSSERETPAGTSRGSKALPWNPPKRPNDCTTRSGELRLLWLTPPTRITSVPAGCR